jgi:hypothetical protein
MTDFCSILSNNVGFIIGILGFILTVISVIINIFPSYKGKICLLMNNLYNIFDLSIKKFKNLSILYNGETIDSQIYVFHGFLLNNGRKDFDKNSLDDPLYITFPPDTIILEIKINSEIEIFEVEPEINRISIKINRLFKINDLVSIEVLFKSEKYYDLYDFKKEVRVLGRINGAGKIKILFGYDNKYIKESLKINILVIFGYILTFVLLYWISLDSFANKYHENPFQYKVISLKNDNEIYYTGLATSNIYTITNNLLESYEKLKLTKYLEYIDSNIVSNIGIDLVFNTNGFTNILFFQKSITSKKLINLKNLYCIIFILFIAHLGYIIIDLLKHIIIIRRIKIYLLEYKHKL